MKGYEVKNKQGDTVGHVWGEKYFYFLPSMPGRRGSKKNWTTPEASIPRWVGKGFALSEIK